MDFIHIRIQAREEVKRAHRLYRGNAGNLIELLVGDIALAQKTPAGTGELKDRLPATQRHLDSVLRRYVRAQACSGQKLKAFDEATGVVLRAGKYHPAGTVATHAIGLG